MLMMLPRGEKVKDPAIRSGCHQRDQPVDGTDFGELRGHAELGQ